MNGLSQAKRRLLGHTAWWRKVITGDKFMNDFRRMGQVMAKSSWHFYDNPGCQKLFPLKQIFQSQVRKDEFLGAPWTSSESSSPTIHTYLGKWLLSPFSLYSWDPSIAPERWPGPAWDSLFIRKGIFVLLEIHHPRNQYVFRWGENAFLLENDFLNIFHYTMLTNT